MAWTHAEVRVAEHFEHTFNLTLFCLLTSHASTPYTFQQPRTGLHLTTTLLACGTSAVAGCTTQHNAYALKSASHWVAHTQTILENHRGGQTNTQSITQVVSRFATIPHEHPDVAQEDDVQRHEVSIRGEVALQL